MNPSSFIVNNIFVTFCFLFLLSVLSFSYCSSSVSAQKVAIIGDYGRAVPQAGYSSTGEALVANLLIQKWNSTFSSSGGLDAIITTGDNNYDGFEKTIDANIGQFYCKWIVPYNGNYSWCQQYHQENENWLKNRFWPSLGNIDAGPHNGYGKPYLDYFKGVIPPVAGSSAPFSAGARYYDVIIYRNNSNSQNVIPMIHLFAINSNEWEPDGVAADSKQALWLKNALATSPCPFRVVYFHYLPYSFDNRNGPSPFMRWPFLEWGASVVISGHAHVYQKIFVAGFTYLGMGLSGTPNIYAINITKKDVASGNTFSKQFEGLMTFFNATYGAQLIEIADDASEMKITFHSVDGLYHDSVRFPRKSIAVPAPSGGSGDNNNNNENDKNDGQTKLAGLLFGVVGTTVICFVFLAIGYCYKRKHESGSSEREHPLRNRSAVRAQQVGQRMQISGNDAVLLQEMQL